MTAPVAITVASYGHSIHPSILRASCCVILLLQFANRPRPIQSKPNQNQKPTTNNQPPAKGQIPRAPTWEARRRKPPRQSPALPHSKSDRRLNIRCSCLLSGRHGFQPHSRSLSVLQLCTRGPNPSRVIPAQQTSRGAWPQGVSWCGWNCRNQRRLTPNRWADRPSQ